MKSRLSSVLLQGGGRHTAQAKERALQLVAEMRERGVERNVHTYTALMNVCIKCQDCQMALSTFQLMRQARLRCSAALCW